MEMVAAARLRRAEQRIEAMRPYAQAIRKMARQVSEASRERRARVPLLEQREPESRASASCWSPATAGWPARSTPRSSARACG